jgi:hypothetical protein
MVVQFEANPQDRVCNFILSLANIKQRLAEISTQIKGGPNLEIMILVSAIVKLLAELPAALPSFLLCIASSGITKNPFPVD